MKKILFIADVPLVNPASGSEQVLNQQAIRLLRQGMDVYAITRQADTPARLIRNVEGVHEGSYGASAQKIIPSFYSLVKYPAKFYNNFTRNHPFQAVVCHQPFTCFSLLVAGKLAHIPMIYVFHSPSHEEYLLSHENEGGLKNLPFVIARRLIEKFCLQRSKKITTLSRYMQQKVVKIHGIPADRIMVNSGGADLKRFKPPKNRAVLKKELGFPEGKIHLLTIRNLEPRMGLDNLLQSISILKSKQIDVHLIVGGEGIERKNLENLVVKYGLNNDVSMAGFIPPNLLPEYYGAADFFILPTRSLEGFGLVTPESMACGTPVLGTPVGGTKEILSGFDPEFLFRDASPGAMAKGIRFAIEKYFNDKDKYNELRLCCREYAEKNYSWERHIDQLKLILEEILPLSLSQSAQRH
jgi:glycosyltransferase involved in cell wall biosynthesis